MASVPTSSADSRNPDLKSLKVVAKVTAISGEESVAVDLSMCPDKKIRNHDLFLFRPYQTAKAGSSVSTSSGTELSTAVRIAGLF